LHKINFIAEGKIIMKNKKMNILDYTLRDGGYHNKWNIDKLIVDRNLKSLKAASIDIGLTI